MLCSIYEGGDAEISAAPWRTRKPPASVLRTPTTTAAPIKSVLPDAHQSSTQHHNQSHNGSPADERAAQIEQRVAEAREEGRRAGEAGARHAMGAEMNAAMASLAKTLTEVSSSRAETIRRAEGDIVRLSLEIARRILHREISADSGALEGLVKAALMKLQNQEIHRVRVHPAQEKMMRTALEQNGRGTAVEVVSDSSLPPGGISFEISRGTLDASVDTQLREIENGLVDRMRKRS